jgi:hypothetical protein
MAETLPLTGLTYTCILCHTTGPVDGGRRLKTGSWACKDTQNCWRRLREQGGHS